jgi:UPF0755 protein
VSLDERGTVPSYPPPSYPQTYAAPNGQVPPNGDGFSEPVHHRIATDAGDDAAPAGLTHFEAPVGGRHARHGTPDPAAVPTPAPEFLPVAEDAYGRPAEPGEFVGHDLEPGDDEAAALFDSHFTAGDGDDEFGGFGDWADGGPTGATLLQSPPRRSAERELKRKRRRRRLLVAMVLVIFLVVAGAGWVGYKSFLTTTKVADWTGSGSGQVTIDVHDGDGASAIGTTLAKAGVVASADAFTQAAAKNNQSADIAAGEYSMRLHMSGAAAVTRMLDPTAYLVVKVVVPEGTIEKDIVTKLATQLKVPEATVAAAAANIANIGLPEGYAPAAGPLTSAEGFLFPDTYSLDPGSSPAAALQTMASEFTTEDRSIHFADGAKALNITPYQALIIASIAQSEVKFDTDAPKVARVILNRIAAGMPLQIDATSAYAAKLQGLDPTTVQYATIDSPYNTYTHSGLPPTPIGNPGVPALKAAINPDAGNWLYYVNGDAAGHLFFTNDQQAFEAAVAQCQAQKWGCG